MSCGGRRSCQEQHGRAVNHTEAATFRGSKTERQVEGGLRLTHIHLAIRPIAPGSCWKMKNYMALIRLHYRTSDYMHLTVV